MNKLLTFTGGKPNFNIDDVMWNDDAVRLALNTFLLAYGTNYIVQGCTISGANCLAGYVMLDSELLRVDQHAHNSKTHFAKVTTYNTGGDVTFIDTTARKTWQQNRATLSATTGNLVQSTAQQLIKTIQVPIGVWDMDTYPSVTVNVSAYGITYANVRDIRAYIFSDDSTLVSAPLNSVNTSAVLNGGIGKIDTGDITLYRVASGTFDSTSYNSTAVNRGYILIDYV